MNPLDAIQTVAQKKHTDLHLIIGAEHDFNRIISHDYQVTYPVMFVQKEINPVGTINTRHRFRESVPLVIWFLQNPEQLDIPVNEQRKLVEPMLEKAREFLYNFVNDDTINNEFRLPTGYNLAAIYYNQDFLLYGAQLRFILEYNPDYNIC